MIIYSVSADIIQCGHHPLRQPYIFILIAHLNAVLLIADRCNISQLFRSAGTDGYLILFLFQIGCLLMHYILSIPYNTAMLFIAYQFHHAFAMLCHRKQINPGHALNSIAFAGQIFQVACKSIGTTRDIDDAARCKAGEAA